MATQLQIRRGTSSQVAAFTGAEGEIVVNTTNDSIHVNDGASAGGFELARVDGSNWAITNDITTTSNIDVGTVTADGLTVDGGSVIRSGNTLTLNRTDNAIGGVMSYVAGTGFIFNDANGDGTSFNVGAANRLRITSDGRVGIGTSSPDTLLELVGADPILTIRDSSTSSSDGNATLRLAETGASDTLDQYFDIKATAGQLQIIDNWNEGGGTGTRVVINDSGNVGIGHASPDESLVVNGGVKIRGTNKLSFTNTSDQTFIRAASSNVLAFGTNSLERMRFTTGGNALLGRSSEPYSDGNNVRLHVEGPLPATDGRGQMAISTTAAYNATDRKAMLNFSGAFDTGGIPTFLAGIAGQKENTTNNNYGGALTLHTRPNGAALAERMRIDSSGNLLVGTTSTSIDTSSNASGFNYKPGNCLTVATTVGGNSNIILNKTNSSQGNVVDIRYNGSIVGRIFASASGTQYIVSSDQRLKNNIVDAPSASDDIDAIQVRSFDWKADGSHQKYGMVAQELQGVAPEAVSIPDDPEEMAGVDYSKLVPMLVKEIQSLRSRVQQLENN